MGVFTYPIEIAANAVGPFEAFDAVVDTGAFFMQLPASVLHRLGVRPMQRSRFQMADGRIVESDIGEISVVLDGQHRTTLCVFAEEGSPPIIGAYVLEGFLLSADPVNGVLTPVLPFR